MAFGSMAPGMPAMAVPQMPQQQPGGLNMQALLQMLMQQGRQNQPQQAAPAPGAPQPAPPGAPLDLSATGPNGPAPQSPGAINRLLGMAPGTGMLNQMFAGQPGGTVPTIPPYDPSAPGPNALTNSW